ncbi:hypothetical protein AOQ84DRAFT_134156 [Glonium stellatum]|uniref:Uncharacterized protein n=1 Tax=Glonium stellatum TaxID=574774 RepID=A0A8E2ES65_9PEZI|nr:hypothetical protein AOQ84DRAFT_134156 [Glonium stellatum]
MGAGKAGDAGAVAGCCAVGYWGGPGRVVVVVECGVVEVNRAGQSRAEQGRTGQVRSGQDRSGRGRVK